MIVSFASHDHTKVSCQVSGRGTPLVLVHGTGADHSRWNPIVAQLEQCCTVYALDRRGRGASGDAGAYAFDREVEDLVAVVAGIGGSVDLLGHSFGAWVSIEAAARVANLRRLVLYEPMPTTTPVSPALLGRMDALIADGKRETVVETFLAEVVRLPANAIAAMKSQPTWAARVTAAHTIPRELQASNDYRFDASRFVTVHASTMLLLGGASPPPFRAAIELVHSAIRQAEIVVLPDQQHAAIDTAPDLFAREVLRFLAS